jgi:hypothetical protein
VRDRLRALYENTARIDTTTSAENFVVDLELPCPEHS